VPPEEEKEDTLQEVQGASEPKSRGTILLVDDEQAVRKVAGEILRTIHFDVLAADNGEEALRLYRMHRKDIVLVILDIVMPGMGGSEVFQELRGLNPKVTVLLCSGYSIQGEADRLIGMGASGFIQKPFSLHSLGQSINDILGPES